MPGQQDRSRPVYYKYFRNGVQITEEEFKAQGGKPVQLPPLDIQEFQLHPLLRPMGVTVDEFSAARKRANEAPIDPSDPCGFGIIDKLIEKPEQRRHREVLEGLARLERKVDALTERLFGIESSIANGPDVLAEFKRLVKL
jgi:hypothetical protein